MACDRDDCVFMFVLAVVRDNVPALRICNVYTHRQMAADVPGTVSCDRPNDCMLLRLSVCLNHIKGTIIIIIICWPGRK